MQQVLIFEDSSGLVYGSTEQELQEKLEEVNPSKCLGEIGGYGVACAWTC